MKKLLIAALCLGITGLWSCVEDEVYVGPPAIGTVSIDPAAPTAGVDVTVSATISSSVTLDAVKLYYKSGSGNFTSANMTKGAGDLYTGTIPASVNTDAAVITYYVEAKNSAGTTKSTERNYTVGAAPIDYTKLVINEINGIDKYIEFYNAGTVPINMTGMKLERNNGESSVVFTSGTIAASGYAVVKCNSYSAGNLPSTGCIELDALPSGLSAQAELTIRLYASDGTTQIDSFYTTNTIKNGSYVRIPNGNTTKTGNTGWVATGNNTTGTGTVGAANTAGTNSAIPGLQVPAPAHP